MLKRVGVIALILSSGAALVQPVAAYAQDRYDRGGYSYSDRGRGYRDRDRHENREWREGREREWREHERWENRYDRRYGYYAPAQRYYGPSSYYGPNSYYAPNGYYSPNCPYPY